jgi:hypothetical protein
MSAGFTLEELGRGNVFIVTNTIKISPEFPGVLCVVSDLM